MKKIFYLVPSSFCFGVERAIKQFNSILEQKPSEKIYCVHELVHNPNVNNFFKKKGVQFVEKYTEINNPNSIVIFSAHGTNRATIAKAKNIFKKVINLECPLVSKIYKEIELYLEQDVEHFFYIGKKGHQEAENILAYIKHKGATYSHFLSQDEIPMLNITKKIAILSQTTLNYKKVEAIIQKIKSIYPNALSPNISDICKATYERQGVIHQYINKFDSLIVIGGKTSSNTKELVKIGDSYQKKTFFAESLKDLLDKYPQQTIMQNTNIALTGGASTPAQDIKDVFNHFQDLGYEQKILTLKR